MTYTETIDYLYGSLPMFSRKGGTAIKKDLTNIKAFCAALGNPQNTFKSIHIGGTNGKGSVCHMLAAVFQKSGYTTGLHTSPHLKDFRERIRINGKVAPQDFVVDFVKEHRNLIETIKPSFFEISVAMAFSFFAEKKVDIAIIEVGLGGRLDSTNILKPVLSVITNISLEHTQILGDTRAEIAGEKAGIIKAHTPVIVGKSDEETEEVFIKKAQQLQAPLFFADQYFCATRLKMQAGRLEVCVQCTGQESVVNFELDLGGYYQLQNLQTLLEAVTVLRTRQWKLPEEQVKAALADVRQLTGLRGRWEVLGRQPLIIADTSHNEAGIQQVLKQIKTIAHRNLYLVIGFLEDKNLERMLPLFPREVEYFFCQPNIPRALSSEELKQMAAKTGLLGASYPTVYQALEAAKEKALPADAILITGSTFIVAEII